METRQSRVLRVAPVVPFLVLLLGCSKAGTDPQGGVQGAAVLSTTGAANASSATPADMPATDGGGATPPAASEHLPALEVCQRVVAAKIFSNAGALTILVADGELRPADIASLKAMVAGLR